MGHDERFIWVNLFNLPSDLRIQIFTCCSHSVMNPEEVLGLVLKAPDRKVQKFWLCWTGLQMVASHHLRAGTPNYVLFKNNMWYLLLSNLSRPSCCKCFVCYFINIYTSLIHTHIRVYVYIYVSVWHVCIILYLSIRIPHCHHF